jgi:hypothetical protein
VDQGADRNNTNEGGTAGANTDGKGGTTTPAKPNVDISNAVKVKITKNGAVNMIPVTIGEGTSVEMAFELAGKYTAVTPEIAAEWFTNKIINKGSFLEGEKMKVGDVKLPSNKFVIEKLKVGEYELTNVQFVISENVEVATLGKAFFRNFKAESYIDGSELVLIPKKVPKKKTEE